MRRLAAFLALNLLALLLLACSQDEEVTPIAATTVTSSPVVSESPSPVPTLTTASPNPTEVAGCPEVFPSMTMQLSGPNQVRPGEEVTYQLAYSLTGTKSTEMRFEWNDPKGSNLQSTIPYVSSQRLEGEGPATAVARLIDGRIWEVIWGAREGSGRVAVTLRVAEDPLFTSFIVGAYVPGNCAPGSNPVTTEVMR